ncbi:MAG: c-type cytochrome [Geminicoccaceae bacterium]
MCVSVKACALAGALSLVASPLLASEIDYSVLGTEATGEQIAAWDIDVRPDGHGLPEGSGSAEQGEELYLEQCAYCHGEFGEGIDRYPVLMGGEGTLDTEDPFKTVGSYWPYASTLWDYIHRAMPFGQAQTLSVDDTYAISAYVLYLNDLVEFDEVLDQDTFTQVEMPNAEGFILPDPRPDVPAREPCMTDCDVPTEIVGRARIIDVTPDDEDIGLSVD